MLRQTISKNHNCFEGSRHVDQVTAGQLYLNYLAYLFWTALLLDQIS
ncbi:hypothetical protein SMF913_14561 [Streptomyces malaysiensis]|uniref:Uncharacterized protein n=1 Tax=Streptomyces malaysiensis TaxID=92644 RepID=A0A2J7ZE31_STRMQ|nr:hypothetical protein SMF913_14561 [Streptomyces malaysiensis]